MCANRKHLVNRIAAPALCAIAMLAGGGAAFGQTAGGVALGDSDGGVTDRAYVSAPPNYLYVVEKEPGSFLDCGEGREARLTDGSGRDLAGLACGVTLTETMVIPAAADSARIIVHY